MRKGPADCRAFFIVRVGRVGWGLGIRVTRYIVRRERWEDDLRTIGRERAFPGTWWLGVFVGEDTAVRPKQALSRDADSDCHKSVSGLSPSDQRERQTAFSTWTSLSLKPLLSMDYLGAPSEACHQS